jgi:hypothetical protein
MINIGIFLSGSSGDGAAESDCAQIVPELNSQLVDDSLGDFCLVRDDSFRQELNTPPGP